MNRIFPNMFLIGIESWITPTSCISRLGGQNTSIKLDLKKSKVGALSTNSLKDEWFFFCFCFRQLKTLCENVTTAHQYSVMCCYQLVFLTMITWQLGYNVIATSVFKVNGSQIYIKTSQYWSSHLPLDRKEDVKYVLYQSLYSHAKDQNSVQGL